MSRESQRNGELVVAVRPLVLPVLGVLTLVCSLALSFAQTAQKNRKNSTVTLTVHLLPTEDASNGPNGTNLYASAYPKTVELRDANEFSRRIEAYGTAYQVWIAPKGWNGSAQIGGDGSTIVDLHSPKGPANSGPHFEYENDGGCAGCAEPDAAPFFPRARREMEQDSFGPAPALPHGFKVISASSDLVSYAFLPADGLAGRGVAYYKDRPDYFFEEAEFVLPRTDTKLLQFLVRTFISREKLK